MTGLAIVDCAGDADGEEIRKIFVIVSKVGPTLSINLTICAFSVFFESFASQGSLQEVHLLIGDDCSLSPQFSALLDGKESRKPN